MIKVTSTPNNLGARVSGSFDDFSRLYDAIHEVAGMEGEYKRHTCSFFRTLGFCYDLRHAIQGDRQFEFCENRLDENMPLPGNMIASSRNLRMAFDTMWPEMLFVMAALNDLIILYSHKLTREKVLFMCDKNIAWDGNIAAVRGLQAAVADHFRATLAAPAYSKINNALNRGYSITVLDGYAGQYIDILNHRFAKLDRKARLTTLPGFAKKITEMNAEYRELKDFVETEAKKKGCDISDIRLAGYDVPEDIEF